MPRRRLDNAARRSSTRANRRFGEVLIDSISARLESSGFKQINAKGQPILPNERIFNLGLDGSRSNVFVFALHDERNNSVRVLLSSARSDRQAPAMGRKEIYFKKEFRRGDTEKIAELVAQKAGRESLAKHPQEFRMQTHIHAGTDFDGEKFFDDGVSNIVDVVRRAMLHHTDVLVYTPHNSYHPQRFRMLQNVCKVMGMSAVLGMELTAPLVKKHFNGPHLVLMLGNQRAAIEVARKILSKREKDLKMPSYWRSPDGNILMDDMLRILEPLRQNGKACLGAAHPVNYNSKMLAIKAVGLISAVDLGQIDLRTAISIAKSLDFLEVWNRSISPDSMPLNNAELYNELTGLVHKFNLGDFRKANANTFGLALGMNLDKHHSGQQTFGTDDHCTTPLDHRYLVGGDYLGAGFTFFKSDKTLRPNQIVRAIADRSLNLSAHIYTELDDGMVQIAHERVAMPARLEAIVSKLKARHLEHYIRFLSSDFFGFIGKGEFDMLGNMDK